MTVIYEVHKGEDKVTIIEEGLAPERCAENIDKVLRALFPPTEIRITTTGVHEDKGG